MSLKANMALGLLMVGLNIVWAAPSGRKYQLTAEDEFHPRQTRQTKVKSLPLPENAKVPANLPGKTYYRATVADGVHYVLKEGGMALFIVTKTGVVVVDAPMGMGEDIKKAIADVTTLKVTHIIYTHFHSDHIGDSSLFTNVLIYAHEETATVLKERKDPKRPVPTRTFCDKSMTFFVGGKKIQLDYHGPIHTPGNIFVWLPNEKVLYTADAISPGAAPYTRFGIAEDTVAYLETPDKILSYPFTYFFGGHSRLGTRQDVVNQKEYLQDIQKNVMAALPTVDYNAVVATQEDPNNGDLSGVLYGQAVAKKCTELQVAKWGTKLGYVDVYGPSHCEVIMIAQRIDYGSKVVG